MILSTMRPIAITVVRLADGLVEGLVVNAVETSSSDGSWLDGLCESARNQAGDEFTAVLATRRAGERAVLPFQEAPGVDHDRYEELTLPLREADDVAEAHHPAAPTLSNVGLCGIRASQEFLYDAPMRAERPPLPRDPTT